MSVMDDPQTLRRTRLAYGDGALRVTPEQDLLFRWVRKSDGREQG